MESLNTLAFPLNAASQTWLAGLPRWAKFPGQGPISKAIEARLNAPETQRRNPSPRNLWGNPNARVISIPDLAPNFAPNNLTKLQRNSISQAYSLVPDFDQRYAVLTPKQKIHFATQIDSLLAFFQQGTITIQELPKMFDRAFIYATAAQFASEKSAEAPVIRTSPLTPSLVSPLQPSASSKSQNDGYFTEASNKIWEQYGIRLPKPKKTIRLNKSGVTLPITAKSGTQLTVALFDSSNGGLAALKSSLPYIQELERRLGRTVNVVVITDHGNAPYGSKTPEELVKLVRAGLLQAQAQGTNADIVIMACNTACTAFYPQQGNRYGNAARGMKVPVVDLVANTVSIMNQRPGEIALFATPATVNSKTYSRLLKQNFNRSIQEVGPADWAPLVNQLAHQSNDPVVRARVQASVDAQVDKLNKNIGTIFLCCTHYPQLTPYIEIAIKKRQVRESGFAPKIVDPMAVQTQIGLAQLSQQPMAPATPGGYYPLGGITVITTGGNQSVKTSTTNLAGQPTATVRTVDRFGTGAKNTQQIKRDKAANILAYTTPSQLTPNYRVGGYQEMASAMRNAKDVLIEFGVSGDGRVGGLVLTRSLALRGKRVTIVCPENQRAPYRKFLEKIGTPMANIHFADTAQSRSILAPGVNPNQRPNFVLSIGVEDNQIGSVSTKPSSEKIPSQPSLNTLAQQRGIKTGAIAKGASEIGSKAASDLIDPTLVSQEKVNTLANGESRDLVGFATSLEILSSNSNSKSLKPVSAKDLESAARELNQNASPSSTNKLIQSYGTLQNNLFQN